MGRLRTKEKASPQTADELTQKNVEEVLRLEKATRGVNSRADQISDSITRFGGSMMFVYLHLVWYAGWISINVLAPARFRFDPFPFSFLTLTVSLEAIFLSAFILISQNRQNVVSERRAQLDLQINVLSEQENTKMLCLLQEIARKVGVEVDSDREIDALAQAVQPKQLAEQIEQTAKRNENGEGNGVSAKDAGEK